MHGYSIEAQRESLSRYAREHDLFIAGYYVDEGASARKKYTTRREFMRMLADVQADKLDVILFIKLDRWFRSVADYYKVQEILDAHHVDWLTTEEQYDTTTTNGRLYINIRLSLAQDEADRTSDRIKFVFASKLERHEVLTGRVPPGYRIENKHLVHDPEKAPIIRDLFHYYAEHGSKRGAIQYIFDTYGMKIGHYYFRRMLQNTLYKGEFRGVSGYCEPLIEPELFDRLSVAPNARANPTRRVYIFSGLAVCAVCGSHMAGCSSYNRSGGEYIYYRCNRYANYKDCKNTKLANEKRIEAWLLEHVEEEAEAYLLQYHASRKKRKKPQTERATIKRKLKRLKELYVNELIDLAAYRADYEELTAQLALLDESEQPEVNVKPLEDFLQSGFRTTYDTLTREQRHALWRSVIKSIQLSPDGSIVLSFA